MTIADRIRITREGLNLSQEALAKRCGYADKTSISKIENSGDDITLKKIKRIADALGVSHSYLMGWEDEDKEKTAYGHINDNNELQALIDSLPENEKKEVFDFIHRIIKLPPEARTSLLALLKNLVPGT